MDDRTYPQGATPFYSKYVGGVLKFFRRSDNSEFYSIDGANKRVGAVNHAQQLRTRLTVAQVNAGFTLLAALPGYKYRLLDAAAIAVGGAVTTVTTVDILGTQSTVKKLVAFGQAALTQSTLVRAGSAGGVLLADGASFAACDANTAITANITGSSITVATSVDFLLSYVIEVA